MEIKLQSHYKSNLFIHQIITAYNFHN